MSTVTINLGPGKQVYHADDLLNSGDHLSISGGSGGDTIVSGGGGNVIRPPGFIYRVVANTGLDRAFTVEIDHYYTESLPDPQNHWVGGHRLIAGTNVYAEFHQVAVGAGDHVRVSLFDQLAYEYSGVIRMMAGHVPGLIEIHGPGVKGYTTKIKAFDPHEDGQQFSWAAEGMHQTRIEGIQGTVTRDDDGDNFIFFVERFIARAITTDPLTNGQRGDFVHMGMLRGESREMYELEIEADRASDITYEDKREAVEDMFEEWASREDPAVLWAV